MKNWGLKKLKKNRMKLKSTAQKGLEKKASLGKKKTPEATRCLLQVSHKTKEDL